MVQQTTKNQFYDGTKLLSLKDINGNKPEIYLVTTNRSAGKTTYFSKMMVKKFLENGEKFMIIYRYNYELDSCADKFFKEIKTLFFNDYNLISKRLMHGIYHELWIGKNDEKLDEYKCCGYAISLNSADQIKRNSHLFSDTQRMLFDEFQSESNHYCNNEVQKFISIHTSVARGQGKQYRYLPVYMLSNSVSLINPYYSELNISSRLTKETKYLRGDGFVLEQGFNENASIAQNNSAFNRAFMNNDYIAYSTQGVYLNDNLSFIEKPSGKNNYLCTLKYKNNEYAVREYPEAGVIYCDTNADASYPVKISVTTADHSINYVMLNANQTLLSTMRYLFERGCFRFKDLMCKECVLKALSY